MLMTCSISCITFSAQSYIQALKSSRRLKEYGITPAIKKWIIEPHECDEEVNSDEEEASTQEQTASVIQLPTTSGNGK